GGLHKWTISRPFLTALLRACVQVLCEEKETTIKKLENVEIESTTSCMLSTRSTN
ncbi:hypothetical protein THAOC_15686, partial [Thalassiosira oceanica]